MKNKIIYLFAFIFSVLIMSCEDQLNVEPALSISDEKALSSAESIQKLLIGTYELDGIGYSHGGYIQVFTDLLGADQEVSWNGTFYEPREALTKNMLAINFLIGEIWNNTFKVINQSNLILDNLDVIEDVAERERVEGEARFLRAFNNFELVRLFGNETLGIPLRLTSVTDYSGDLSVKRSTTAEVYAAILEDLTLATTLLPDDNDVYADKYAATALLARIHLYLGNYAEARDAAQDVILTAGKTLSATYGDAFNHEEDGSEDVYAVQVTSQSGENILIAFYASEENGGRGGDISINQEYLDVFDDPNDERSSFFYMNPRGDVLTNKYTYQFGDIPIVRLAEMYLIRAESNIRLGTNVGATPTDDINLIRLRSGASSFGSVTLDDILAERKRELAFEGFGIYDIKRTNGSVLGLPFNSPALVMPIPQAEMDTNILMEQNEGY